MQVCLFAFSIFLQNKVLLTGSLNIVRERKIAREKTALLKLQGKMPTLPHEGAFAL